MATSEKAHLRGAGLHQNSIVVKRGNQTPVSNQSANAASAVLDAWGIDQIWQALGGGQLRRGRGRAFWRNGQGFNVAIDVERGSWWDFARSDGGGKLALIQRVLGVSRHDALEWLSHSTGISLQARTFSRDQRRQYAVACKHAERIAEAVEDWAASKCAELEAQKRQSNGDLGPWDEGRLEVVSSELWQFERMTCTERAATWARANRTEPDQTLRLEAKGREWRVRYREAVRLIVEREWRKGSAYDAH